ncbi:NAD(P)-binding protein [Lentithecium fluviatile CBS 122367]|uniref:NAD(P)-binding protein n=1 Tax=Lentithecium fluviatile CBS 122367 TaxID=1168545 RepID=A0A6G1J9V5_9PLEO|nr:NAD(P)-binding protein [Lentithecium fluviatile CBS 122367]
MSSLDRSPTRIAVDGTGLIGPRHAEAVVHEPRAELACIVDLNPAAQAVAEKFNCPLYESVEQMLSQSVKVDGALVCTPNHTHVAVSKVLLKGGVATKQALPSLGRIIAVNGPILINLIHEIDILHHWFGPISRVLAEKTPSQRGYEAEEGAAITLRFVNGIVGTFVLSDAVVSPHNFEAGTGENPLIPRVGCDSYRIFGSEGSLSFPDMMRWMYPTKRSWNEHLQCEQVEVPEKRIPFELQIEHFVNFIRGEESPSCSGRDGLRAVGVCAAIRKSMREGLPVNIPLEGT